MSKGDKQMTDGAKAISKVKSLLENLQKVEDMEKGDAIDPREIENIKKNPELVDRYSNPPYGNKKGQKKILCIALSASKGVMPTLVSKPVKMKYGSRWFTANKGTYFINYKALIDVGKHYLYMTTEDNAVGACYLVEHMEFADSNQVELMVNQHAVEVFKKNKGIPVKLLLIIGIAMLVAVVATVILAQFVVGANARNGQLTSTNTVLTTENQRYHALYGELPPITNTVTK
jgi:hypothetical protein